MEGQTTVPGVTAADLADLEALDREINALLPPMYRDRYDKIEPVSMGSAGLKFGADGKVAWDEIWTTFCDLALAGGPPHRGTLLVPASADEVHAEPEAYQKVTEEIGRGIWMVTYLHVLPMVAPGWIGVFCRGATMAAWLTRAIVAENVYARHDGERLYLPAGPHYRLEKEIKNVITALAKTNHYWAEHLTSDQRTDVANLTGSRGLIVPATPEQFETEPAACEQTALTIEKDVHAATGMTVAPRALPGWVGFTCGSEGKAIGFLRAVSVANVVAWREGDTLHVPVPPAPDDAAVVVAVLSRAHHLWNVYRAVHAR